MYVLQLHPSYDIEILNVIKKMKRNRLKYLIYTTNSSLMLIDCDNIIAQTVIVM